MKFYSESPYSEIRKIILQQNRRTTSRFTNERRSIYDIFIVTHTSKNIAQIQDTNIRNEVQCTANKLNDGLSLYTKSPKTYVCHQNSDHTQPELNLPVGHFIWYDAGCR